MGPFRIEDLENPSTLAELAAALAEICQATGQYLKAEREAFNPSRAESKGVNDLVSYVDREAERRTIEALQGLLPGAAFIAEEGTLSGSDGFTDPGAGTYWIIDPLDGTTNFVHNLPAYAVSIGLLHEGKLIAGSVAVPALGELYVAWTGGGAWCNGKRLQVSAAADFGHSLLATGFPFYPSPRMEPYLKVLGQFMPATHGLRRFGSAAIDLAWTAAGRFEGYFEYNLKAWDCAAGILLVQEAGGTVTDFKGGTHYLFGGEIIAAGPIHSQMLGVIREAFHGA